MPTYVGRLSALVRVVVRNRVGLLLLLGAFAGAAWLAASANAQNDGGTVSPRAAVMDAAGVSNTTLDSVTAGKIAEDAPDQVRIEGRTFAYVQDRLEKPPDDTNIPLRSVLGKTLMHLTDVSVTVDPDTFSVTFIGTATDAPKLGDATVLVLADWQSRADDNPTLVVSARAGPRTLGKTLSLGSSGTFAADLSVGHTLVTGGVSAIDVGNDPEHQHISRSTNLTAAAAGFFEEVYGDELPQTVPALAGLGTGMHLSAVVDLDDLGDIAGHVLSVPAGKRVVLEGNLGLKLAKAAKFTAKSKTWSLGATLPAESGIPSGWPSFLTLDSSVRPSISISYGAVIPVGEDLDAGGDGAAPAKAVTVNVGAHVSTDLFGNEKSYEAQLQFGFAPKDESVSIAFDLEAHEAWNKPFGIDFLDLDNAEIEGRFSGGAKVTFAGLVKGSTTVAGKEFEARLTGRFGGDDVDAALELATESKLGIGDLLGALDVDTSALPNALTSPAIGPAGIEIGISRSGNEPVALEIAASGEFSFTLANDHTLAVRGLFSIDGDKGKDGKRGVVAGVRSAGELTLSALLPGDVEVPFDFDLVDEDNGSAFGFVVSTRKIDTTLYAEPKFVRDFYRPLLGMSTEDTSDHPLELPKGVSVLGAFQLPDQIAGIVDTLGLQSTVLASGSLPIFSEKGPVKLSLGLALKFEHVPDFIDDVVGKLNVEVGATPTPHLELALEGDLTLRLPAGLPAAVADPLNDAGIPVQTFAALDSEDSYCAPGSTAEKTHGGDTYRCYNTLKLSLEAAFKFQTSEVELELEGAAKTPGADNVYHPFGLEWLGIDQLRLQLGLNAKASGSVGIDFGFMGKFYVGDVDLLAAAKVGVSLIPEAPWAKIDFEGIRMASGHGFSISDLFGLQHTMSTIAGLPGAAIDPADLGIPDIGIRNVDFSFSPKGVKDLCIPQGLVLSGDLYVNPSGDAPTQNPQCDNGKDVIPEPEDRCENRVKDGCLASGRLVVSTKGIEGLGQIPKLDLGPIHLSDLNLDVALTLKDQHFIMEGSGHIDDPTGAMDGPLAEGKLKIALKPTKAVVYGSVQALGVSALVDVGAGLDVFKDPSSLAAHLHVVLATDRSGMSSPSLPDTMLKIVNTPLTALARGVQFVEGVTQDFEDDGGIGMIQNLPDRLEDAGVPVPGWVNDFIDALGPFFDAIEHAEDVLGDILDFGWDALMNGIHVELGGNEICDPFGFGACVDLPSIDFDWDGVCGDIFPASDFPDLRDSDGDCDADRVIPGILIPLVDTAISKVVGTDVDLQAIFDKIVDYIASGQPPVELTCAALSIDLNSDQQDVEMALNAKLFGHPIGFQAGVNLADPWSDLAGLVPDFVDELLHPQAVGCAGPDPDLFASSPPAPVSSNNILSVAGPGTVSEGQQVTLTAQVGGVQGLHNVTVVWGDGSTPGNKVVTVNGESTSVQFTHRYPDERAGDGGASLFTVQAIDRATAFNGATESATVTKMLTVTNIPPDIRGAVPSSGVEHQPVSLNLVAHDDGHDATTTVIHWGDGTNATTLNGPLAGAGSQNHAINVSHTYRAMPVDQDYVTYTVRVQTIDDDGDSTTRIQQVKVKNAGPNVLKGKEGVPKVVGTATGTVTQTYDEPFAFVMCTATGGDKPTIDDMTVCGLGKNTGAAEVDYDITGIEHPILWMQAVDGSGRTGALQQYPMIVDTTPPVAPKLSGPAGPTDQTSVRIYYRAGEQVLHVQCTLDDTKLPCGLDKAPGSDTGIAGSALAKDLREGLHTVKVSLADRAGNVSKESSLQFIVDLSPPDTTIEGVPNPESAYGSFTFGSNDVSPVTYECAFDGGDWTACGQRYSTPELSEGPHHLAVRATDAMGRTDETPAVYDWTADFALYVYFDTHPDELTAQTSATFTWHTAGVAKSSSIETTCRIDLGAPKPCNSPTTLSDVSDGQHSFEVTVSAIGSSGKAEKASRGVTWYVDTAPGGPRHAPETEIDSGPENGGTFSGAKPLTYTFHGDDTEGGGSVSGFRCYLQHGAGEPPLDKLTQPCTSPKTYKNLSDGQYVFAVSAVDDRGVLDPDPATQFFIIDHTQKRSVTITSGPPSLTAVRTATFEFTSNYPDSTFTCATTFGTPKPCTSPFTVQALSPDVEGNYARTFTVNVFAPGASTYTARATYEWTIDTTLHDPPTRIDSGPTGTIAQSDASFRFSSKGFPSATFECSLDGAEYTACPASYTAKNLGDGEHTLLVRAVLATPDGAEVDKSPESRTWTVDTTAPTVHIEMKPPAVSTQSIAPFGFTVSEHDTTLECKLDDGDWQQCAEKTVDGEHLMLYTDLDIGEHTLAVRGTDAVGNVGAPASYTWRVDSEATPETSFRSQPDVLGSSAYFDLESDDVGATFECKLDDREWHACDAATIIRDLASGKHVFSARAVSPDGTVDPTPVTYAFTVDADAPSVKITKAPPAVVTASSVTVAFASADTDLDSFVCRINDITLSECSSPVRLTQLSPGKNVFAVTAYDHEGNESAPASASFTVVPPLTVTIDEAPPAITSDTTATLTFHSDDRTATLKCRQDGGDWVECTSPVTLDKLSGGKHTFDVRATSTENAVSKVVTASWRVDRTAPTVSITSGPSGTVTNSSAAFGFRADEKNATFTCQLDSGAVTSCPGTVDYAKLSSGAHRFRVWASDTAGNRGQPAVRTWTIKAADTTAPVVMIESGPSGTVDSTSARFVFSADDADAVFECRLDDGKWATCTSPVAYRDLAEGAHTFAVRASSDSVTGPSAQRTWVVDLTAPTVKPDETPAAVTNEQSASITFTIDDPHAKTECSLDGGTYTSCTSPVRYDNLAEGAHTVLIRAKDGAGNVSAAVAVRWTIDRTPPTLKLTTTPDPHTTDRTATFEWTVSDTGAAPTTHRIFAFAPTADPAATVACALDGADPASCTSPVTYRDLGVGEHTVELVATDAAGNAASTSFAWTIAPSGGQSGTPPPGGSTTTPPPGGTTSTPPGGDQSTSPTPSGSAGTTAAGGSSSASTTLAGGGRSTQGGSDGSAAGQSGSQIADTGTDVGSSLSVGGVLLLAGLVLLGLGLIRRRGVRQP